MRDTTNEDEAFRVVDCVHDPVVADTDAVVITTSEPDRPDRPGLVRQAVDAGADAITDRAMETAVRADGRRMEAYLVGSGAYSRTSVQETAASRSSRAWRAARLSSR